MRRAIAVFPGLQDPIQPIGHVAGSVPLDWIERQVSPLTRGASLGDCDAQFGPVALALDGCEKESIAADEVWLLYSPRSQPAEAESKAQLTAKILPLIQVFLKGRVCIMPLVVPVTEEDALPGAIQIEGTETASPQERPVIVSDVVDCVRTIPQLLSRWKTERGIDEIVLLLGPGTPQMNSGFLAFASAGSSDIRLLQVLNPKMMAPSVVRFIREIDVQSLVHSQVGELKSRIVELESQLSSALKLCESHAGAPSGNLRMAEFAARGVLWIDLSSQQQINLITEGAATGKSATDLAKILGISRQAVSRFAVQHKIMLSQGKPGKRAGSSFART